MDPNHLPVADSAPYHDALAQSIDHWQFVAEKTELIRDGVNHVFGTETEEGARIIIRISDGSVRSHGELMGELIWLGHLNANGCTVPIVVPSKKDELLESIDHEQGTFHVSCFERFGGRQLDPKTDPDWNHDLFVRLGEAIGRVHRCSDDLILPKEYDRGPWFTCEFSDVPESPPSGCDRRVIDAMRDFTDQMRSLPTKPNHYGLIHRDLHAGNFLVENGEIQLIDFDLGCYGWRAMDFMVLLNSHYYYPSLRVPHATPELAGEVLASMVQGYQREYPVEQEQLDLLASLLKLRQIVMYLAMAPAIDYWQIAMGNPHPTAAESKTWIEDQWRSDKHVVVDLSQIRLNS